MRSLDCAHCGKIIAAEGITSEDKACPHCGMPLSPHKRKSPQRKFIWWFIAIVIFCFVMMYFLPSFNASKFTGN